MRLQILVLLLFFAISGFAADSVTFNKDIAPIVFQNCTGCHHAGEVAPFELMNYDDTVKHAKQIVRVTKRRVMPPWRAEKGYGEFHGERRLSDAQISQIEQWVDAGMPAGDPRDLPQAPKFVDGWSLGQPDMIFKMPEEYAVPAEGRDIYRCFVIPTNLKDDTYVAAVEYRPSNRKVVHHAILYLDNSGVARMRDGLDPEPGFKTFGGPGFIPSGGLGGWAPGAFPRRLPDGLAKLMRKNSDLVIQLHFHPTGKIEKEQSQIGIYLAKRAPDRPLVGSALGTRKIDIPAGEKAHLIQQSLILPVDVELFGITPHAHLICKEIKAHATLPDGKDQPLIWIKDWDFNWQDQYQYEKPIKLPKGTKIDVAFTYDNSESNPRNPNAPPQRVRHGEQTTDEMALLFLQAICENKEDALALLKSSQLKGIANAFTGGTVSDPQPDNNQVWEGLKKRFESVTTGKADASKWDAFKKKYDKDGDGTLNGEERRNALMHLEELLR